MIRKYKTKALLSFALALIISVSALGQGQTLTEAAASEAQQNQQDIKSKKSKISDLEKKQAELDEKIAATKDDISAQQENQQAIQEQIDTVGETIAALSASIAELDAKIDKLGKDIIEQEAAVAAKREEIDKGINDFKGRLRALYIAGSESYADVLLGADDFYDMLMKMELIKRVTDHDNEEIDRLVAIKNDYEAQLAVLEQNRDELNASNEELKAQKEKSEKQKKKLAELYKQSEQVINELKKSEEAYEKNKEKLEAERNKFEADLQALYKKEEERKAREKAEAEAKAEAERKKREAEQAQQQQQQTTDNTYYEDDEDDDEPVIYDSPAASTGFIWPVPGQYGITSYMGWRWGAFHKGIDISTWGIRGSNVVAAADGTVLVADGYCTHDWPKDGSCGCGGGYGNYVIIDHGNGYWTLYGHMMENSVTVTPGQYVKQGQKIGQVGTTGWSTGDHCHFEVRQNGNPVDPTQYVSY
ncbi:MAG: peptidoglycan DD-metalloendopeptidase family protein [Ruminococcus sp.]|nr:peptidoglycan DD-metalloendopeptidase family protein [Ruminococcus sp.]